MTDFGQVLFILALNNLHYPLHIRSFLESTKLAFLHGFISIQQQNMEGKGKFAYIVNTGLLHNALGNILLILIGLSLAGLGLIILKAL